MRIDREQLQAFSAFALASTSASARYRGDHRSNVRGRGIEFADFRPYDAGDDVRLIDWNVYLRLGTPVVRQFYEERSRSVRLWLDVSRSMGFGQPRKSDVAAALAAGLALCATSRADPVTLSCFGPEPLLPTVRAVNRDGLEQVLAWLHRIEPSGRADPYEQLSRTLAHHRVDETILISDLLVDDDALRRVLRLGAASSRRLVVLHVVGDTELAPHLPELGRVRDSESGEELDLDGSATGAARYRDALQRWLNQVESACRSVHAAYARIDARRGLHDIVRDELPRAGILVPASSGGA